ncbi:MAG: 4-alpha-glucanotransferase [Vicinamibacteria bacterium]|nr:4-alpha-glucanotransferase [Vicinamibacteria bacterium]
MKPSHRVSGILLHPTSLPGPFGIGDLGPAAHRFVDWLRDARQSLWQVLPLGPTGYGDSPYQCFSAFAGNPLLVAPEPLRELGLLHDDDLAHAPAFAEGSIDFGAAARHKCLLLDKAFLAFERSPDPGLVARLASFRSAHAGWLPDYALFAALKAEHEQRSWSKWPAELRQRDDAALRRARLRLGREVRQQEFAQFLFFEQWSALRRHAHGAGIELMGDIPIFVAHDSADVWARPELFRLDNEGRPTHVAGVPPDYFSATGQLWGNPLYAWERMAQDGYGWWVERLRKTLQVVDLVRLDHFRGFEAFWEIPAGESTAVNGQWVKGPGAALFRALHDGLGELPIVAEDLGVITPEVEALRDDFGFPGMAILQFAWGSDSQGPGFQPHNYIPNQVVYTGTHDNETTVGWYTTAGAGDSTRAEAEVLAERAFCRKYLATDGAEIHWDFIRAALASVARTAVIPLQDVLGLGNEARMNLPGRPAGNWAWRLREGELTATAAERLSDLVWTYGRAPRGAALGVAP